MVRIELYYGKGRVVLERALAMLYGRGCWLKSCTGWNKYVPNVLKFYRSIPIIKYPIYIYYFIILI